MTTRLGDTAPHLTAETMSDVSPRPLPADLAPRLVEASGDAIIVADPSGCIVIWNRGATTMFGYEASEAIGQSLDLIIPPRLRARHWDGYHRTMQTGTTAYADRLLAVPGQRRDGSRLSLEFRVTLLTDPAGRPEAIAAVLRDVTERWENDRQLRHQLAQLSAATGTQPTAGPPH
ncbi:MAG TPA: PAS domain S-box protein [Acidimicrobiales bacterium]|nr:PAS domain S-box protein [Acidimicrobiales bacterium]